MLVVGFASPGTFIAAGARGGFTLRGGGGHLVAAVLDIRRLVQWVPARAGWFKPALPDASRVNCLAGEMFLHVVTAGAHASHHHVPI